MNALWDDLGVEGQLLGLTWNLFVNPFRHGLAFATGVGAHRGCWKVIDEETRASV